MALLSRGARLLLLDAGGVSALADGEPIARAALKRAIREGYLVAIPAPVLVEVHTGRRDHARIDRVVNGVSIIIETTAERARQAGVLRAATGVRDVVDAIVVAEAAAVGAAIILTSDPGDIRQLVEAAAATRRIVVIPV